MIRLRKFKRILRNHKSVISRVKFSPFRCCFYSKLANPVRPGQPCTLIVRPVFECRTRVLRSCIRWPEKARFGSNIPEILMAYDIPLSCGYLALDSKDRVVLIHNHLLRDNDINDPPPEILKEILDEMVESFPLIERALLVSRMLDSGVTRNVVQRFVGYIPKCEDQQSK